MNFENSKPFKAHRLLFKLPDKINLKRSDKRVALEKLSICYSLKNIKKLNKNNNSKISASMWNDKFE